MQDIDIISSLKLRGSYGIVGEQGVQAYNSLANTHQEMCFLINQLVLRLF